MPGMEVLPGLEIAKETFSATAPSGFREGTLLLLSAVRPGCGIGSSPPLWLQCLPCCPCQAPAVPSTGLSSASAEPAELQNTLGSVGSAQEGSSSPCPLPMGDSRALAEPVQGFGRLGLRNQELPADLSWPGWALEPRGHSWGLRSVHLSWQSKPIEWGGGWTEAQLRVKMTPRPHSRLSEKRRNTQGLIVQS